MSNCGTRRVCRGEQVADAYLDWMLNRAEADGAVLVAELGGTFAGFAAGWIEQTDNIGETASSNRFGPISDLCVVPAFRGQRAALQLLDGIEQFLLRFGIQRLPINSLAADASVQSKLRTRWFRSF